MTTTTDRSLARLRARLEREIKRALLEGGEAVKREAVRTLEQGARHGALTRSEDGAVHRASAPGEPPASKSGALARSLFVRTGDRGLSVEVGSELDYGRHLEFGTQAMALRPWLRPSLIRAAPEIRARLAEALRRALR